MDYFLNYLMNQMDTTLFDLAEKQASLCKVMGNSRRLLILWQLSHQELSVNEIAARVGSTLQNVSQHLSVLKKTGIVVTRRQGQVIFYQLADHESIRDCLALHSPALNKFLK
jgi:ArsR family transcriptional regulator, virulence genes transcriptional regulator